MPNLIVIVTHGRLAEGLVESAAMICGQVDVVRAVQFDTGMSPEDLERNIDELLSDAGEDHQPLFLTDLPGGTPSRVAATYAATTRAHAVTGVNLPMVIEVVLAAKRRDITELTALAVEKGRDGIIDAGRQIRTALAQDDEGTRT